VLRQLSTGADGLSAITIDDDDPRAREVRWIDATDPDEAELCGAARLLGFSSAVLSWVRGANQSTRPGEVDDALTFVLAVPTVDAAEGGRAKGSTIICAMTKQRALTVHDNAGERVVIDAARSETRRRLGDDPQVAILSVLTEIIDRYDRVVAGLGDSQQAHAIEVLHASDGRESAKEVMAAGLRLAVDISSARSQVRQLRQTVARVRGLTNSLDSASSSIADSLDACSRALDALDADLDSVNDRLKMTTDAQLSLISSRQNELSKNIAAWAGIFAVNAVITGWYGMNIAGLPGSGSWVTVAIIMASVSAVLVVWFRRIGWL
jgi:Mg2+ and Co2+ transporter CorA